MAKMHVVGIDPAPGKESTWYDGASDGPRNLCFQCLRKRLNEVREKEEGVLVCWDAPLTGPSDPSGDTWREGDYTKRHIEKLFTNQKYRADFPQLPKGISVLGYGSCPHWTMTRALLGLPRVGPYDKPLDELPFRLCADQATPPEPPGHYVVEVHPALALWLWCREARGDRADWRYKKDRKVREDVWAALVEVMKNANAPIPWRPLPGPKNDDQLDAVVAWLLGKLWLAGKGDVRLVGDLAKGTFLLPDPCGAINVALNKSLLCRS